jgi:hypothetical protein
MLNKAINHHQLMEYSRRNIATFDENFYVESSNLVNQLFYEIQ